MSGNIATPTEAEQQPLATPPVIHQGHLPAPTAKTPPDTPLTRALTSLKQLLATVDTTISATQLQTTTLRLSLARTFSLAPDPSTRRSIGARQWELMLLEDQQKEIMAKKRKLERFVDRVERGEDGLSVRAVEVLLAALDAVGDAVLADML